MLHHQNPHNQRKYKKHTHTLVPVMIVSSLVLECPIIDHRDENESANVRVWMGGWSWKYEAHQPDWMKKGLHGLHSRDF